MSLSIVVDLRGTRIWIPVFFERMNTGQKTSLRARLNLSAAQIADAALKEGTLANSALECVSLLGELVEMEAR